MAEVQIAFWGIILVILLHLYTIIKGIKHKKGIYELKNSLNQLLPFVGWILSIYILVGWILLLAPMNEYLLNKSIGLSDKSQLVFKSIPLVFSVVVGYIAVRVWWWGFSRPIKYTDKEKQWLLEDNEKWKKSKTYLWIKEHLPYLVKEKEVSK